MIALPRRVLVLAAIAVVLLTCANLWLMPDFQLQFSPTSFGTGPSGYKAAFDLATELGLNVTRSFAAPRRLATVRPLWMISPALLEPESSDGDAAARDLLQWIRSGATAVVFGDQHSAWKRLAIDAHAAAGHDHAAVIGDFAPKTRRVAVDGLLHFDAVPKAARVRLRADGAPFAIEYPVGRGRLIAIADSRFLRNRYLGEADHSLLFIDLLRRFDRVALDEYSHGMVNQPSLFEVMAHSRAMLPLGAGLLLAIVWLFAQHIWPRRRPADAPQLPAPAIAPFVESLGVLYARAADPQAAFRAYRGAFLLRLRRQSAPFGVLPDDAMLERLARDQSLSAETRHWLLGPSLPRNNHELLDAVRAIEAHLGSANG